MKTEEEHPRAQKSKIGLRPRYASTVDGDGDQQASRVKAPGDPRGGRSRRSRRYDELGIAIRTATVASGAPIASARMGGDNS
jgi:hypothetical protein